jgi:hypothetical protein
VFEERSNRLFKVAAVPEGEFRGFWKRFHGKRATFSIKRRQRIFMKMDAPPAFDGSLTPCSRIKMMTPADRPGYIVNETMQVE